MLLSFFFPLISSQCALNIDTGALLQILPGDLGESIEEYDAMPFGALLLLARILIFPGVSRRDTNGGYGTAIWHGASFRIITQITH